MLGKLATDKLVEVFLIPSPFGFDIHFLSIDWADEQPQPYLSKGRKIIWVSDSTFLEISPKHINMLQSVEILTQAGLLIVFGFFPIGLCNFRSQQDPRVFCCVLFESMCFDEGRSKDGILPMV